MALGRQGDRQVDLMVSWAEMPRSPGHVFYDQLQEVLVDAGFDAFAEDLCEPYYAPGIGRPGIPPGRYFRMHLVGYFEGLDSGESYRQMLQRMAADSGIETAANDLAQMDRRRKGKKLSNADWVSTRRPKSPG